MKVLAISYLYPRTDTPQYGIFVKEQMDAIAQNGIDVTILVPLSSQEYNKEKQTQQKKGKITVKYFLFDSIIPGSFNLWIAAKQLALIVTSQFRKDIEECDIVHAHETLCAGYVAKVIGRKFNKPYVVTVHGLDAGFRLNAPYDFLALMNKVCCAGVYRSSFASIGVSKKTCENIHHIDPNARIETVYNGFNPLLFYKKKAKASENFRIVCAGNLIPLKRFCDVIQACSYIRNAGKEFTVDLYGRGPLEQELEQQINLNKLDKIIKLKGYIPSDQLAEAMREADVFIMPSEYESFGCVYVEAMACGIPVIACRGQGIAEILQDGVHGRLVSTRSPEKIAEAVLEMMNDTSKYNQMAKNALELSNHFTWDASAKKIITIYQEAVK